MDLAKTREELAVLAQRVLTAEGEIAALRESRHDHANKLHGLSEAVRQIRDDLAKLRELPDEVAKLNRRIDDMELLVVAKLADVNSRLAKLETKILGWGGLAFLAVELAIAAWHHFSK